MRALALSTLGGPWALRLIALSVASARTPVLLKLRRTDGDCGESAMGDVIWMGIGVVSFVVLALYVFACGRA